MKTGKWIAIVSFVVMCCLLIYGCLQPEEEKPAQESPPAQENPSVEEEPSGIETLLLEVTQILEHYQQRLAELEQAVAQLQEREEPAPAEAADPVNATVPEEQFGFSISGEGYAVITSYSGTAEQVVIPQVLEGYLVVAVGEGAFRNGGMKEVVVPAGVRRVDWFAFSGCHRLERVQLPATVTDIGYGAFERCAASLVFLCPQNCYAAEYAQSYGIPVLPG